MKKIMYFLMVCIFAAVSFAFYPIAADSTTPSIKVPMLDSAGDPVTGLLGTNLTVYFSEQNSAEETIACTALTAITDSYTSGGAYEIGHGWYRIDLTTDAVDGAAGDSISVTVTDETAAAEPTYIVIVLSAPVNAVLVNGNTPISLANGATTINTDASGNVSLSLDAVNASSLAAAATQEIWEYTTRELTALDEDDTTMDLNGTTIGTVTSVTNAVTSNPAWGTSFAITAYSGNVLTCTATDADNLPADLFNECAAVVSDATPTTDTFFALRRVVSNTAESGGSFTITLDRSITAFTPASGDTIYIIGASPWSRFDAAKAGR